MSTSSVSRYLRGEPGRAADRIASAIRELDYRPSAAARSLKSGKTTTLGLVVPDVTNPFFAQVAKGVERVAHAAGYTVILSNTDESPDREGEVLSFVAGHVDGLLLAPARSDEMTMERVRALETPAVFIDRGLGDVDSFDAVLIDNSGGAAAAARHLVMLGHSRIGEIFGPLDTTPGGERHIAFIEACGEDVEVIQEAGDFRMDGGYQATMRLLGMQDPPTALFVANNSMTVGALRAVKDLGVSIPDELSLVGFDDHDLGDLLDPPLTVVDRPTDIQGAIAARLLLKRLSGKAEDPGQEIRLDTKLIIRQSTAPPGRLDA